MRDFDSIWHNARIVTLTGPDGLGIIEKGALAVRDGRIAWVGPTSELTAAPIQLAPMVHDLAGALVTPALIDCHTHLVFAGDRSGEFEARLRGESYEDIARAGGGILSTVQATREASPEELVAATVARLKALKADGVATVEIKSGYGLDLPTELKMLQAARQAGLNLGLRVTTTFLGAHTVPPEYAGRADAYIDFLCDEVLPEIVLHNLADAVDAYHESIAFNDDQVTRLFAKAAEVALPARLHADQLSDLGGAALAARLGAKSADHLEYTSSAGVEAMAGANMVAVLLPGAYFSLRQTQPPPVGALRAAGVPMAVATDANPGTSPLLSLRMAMSMAATQFGLSVEECWRGVTVNAARALGLENEVGQLKDGMTADFAVWDAASPAELVQWIGDSKLRDLVIGGEIRH